MLSSNPLQQSSKLNISFQTLWIQFWINFEHLRYTRILKILRTYAWTILKLGVIFDLCIRRSSAACQKFFTTNIIRSINNSERWHEGFDQDRGVRWGYGRDGKGFEKKLLQGSSRIGTLKCLIYTFPLARTHDLTYIFTGLPFLFLLFFILFFLQLKYGEAFRSQS